MIDALKEEIRVLKVKITINSNQEKFRSGQFPLDKGILLDIKKLAELEAKLPQEKPAKKKNRKRDD